MTSQGHSSEKSSSQRIALRAAAAASGGPGPGAAEHQSLCWGRGVPAGPQPAAVPTFSLHEPKGRGLLALRLVLSTVACALCPCRAHSGPRRAVGSARPIPLHALAFGLPPPTFPLSFISWFHRQKIPEAAPLSHSLRPQGQLGLQRFL